MSKSAISDSPEILEAYKVYEAQERITNTKIGCALVVTLMPLGSTADFFVYRDRLVPFFVARLICSALAGAIWLSLFTEQGRKRCQWLGQVVPLLPVVFLAWIIAVTDGFASSYYAALNLVLLAVGAVLHWTLVESMVAVFLVLVMYVVAGFWAGNYPGSAVMFANFYFISLMDIIVVVGTYFQSRQRFREFALRFELDQNKKALEESNQKLVELDQIKSRFFANISHELRTPLTLLLSPLETMLQRPNSPLDDPTRNLLGIMHANGMRLLKLINDLLDLVRLESGRLQAKREPMEIGAFVKGLASATQQMAQEKQIRLELTAEPGLGAILADRDKLDKVFLNLIFNALKFTPKGGLVALHAFRAGDNFVTTVRDTGVGIAPKSLPYIFDRFWQADNSSNRKFQGVGIGLSLVKELTELHGGNVKVESQEGKGTTFTVSIPFVSAENAAPVEPVKSESAAPMSAESPDKAPAAQSDEWLVNLYRRAELFPAIAPPLETAASAEQVGGGHQWRLLLADDEPDMRRFLKSQLQTHYRVFEAEDGKQAVERATELVPDIILLDMNMPEKDGLQVCRELRAQATTQKIPIIMLTARADEETKLVALSAGANDFLGKPFSTTELHVRIKNLIESHDYQQKLSQQNQQLETAIGQLKETESQLVQTEKLASLGRMSAGIIHEINNPLNFATTGLYALKNKMKYIEPEQQTEYSEIITDIEDGIKRVKNIVSDLRQFTHHDNESVEHVEAAEVVAASLRFMSHEWRDLIQLEQKLAATQKLAVNKNKLIQVCVNLLQNSIDALKGKAFTNGEQPTVWIESRMEGDRTSLIFRDNGPGIDPENLGKIFDPFFTTKDVGEGMGLGLSICYRIVQQYGGRILVRSEPGKFCEFTLEFPAKA